MSEPLTVVSDLRLGTTQTFSLPPETAVLAAWRQSLHDWSTWNYDKWQGEVKKLEHTWHCHGFSAMKEGA